MVWGEFESRRSAGSIGGCWRGLGVWSPSLMDRVGGVLGLRILVL